MISFSKKPESIFIGYNIKNGSQGYGTFKNVPGAKLLEMPTAEQLMAGVATGMALTGLIPILFFERHDFLLLASDQIINHLAKIKEMSHGEFNPKVIIRAIIGHNKPFNPGPQHMGNYTQLFAKEMKTFYGFEPAWLPKIYDEAFSCKEPCMIVEEKKHYNMEIL